MFIADMSAGDQSTLVSWSLSIEAVPEPINIALGIFAGAALGVFVIKRLRENRLSRRLAPIRARKRPSIPRI